MKKGLLGFPWYPHRSKEARGLRQAVDRHLDPVDGKSRLLHHLSHVVLGSANPNNNAGAVDRWPKAGLEQRSNRTALITEDDVVRGLAFVQPHGIEGVDGSVVILVRRVFHGEEGGNKGTPSSQVGGSAARNAGP